jgi:hypothetical protein
VYSHPSHDRQTEPRLPHGMVPTALSELHLRRPILTTKSDLHASEESVLYY